MSNHGRNVRTCRAVLRVCLGNQASCRTPWLERTPKRSLHRVSRHSPRNSSAPPDRLPRSSSTRPLFSAGCTQSPACTPSRDVPWDFPLPAQSTCCDCPACTSRTPARQNRRPLAVPLSAFGESRQILLRHDLAEAIERQCHRRQKRWRRPLSRADRNLDAGDLLLLLVCLRIFQLPLLYLGQRRLRIDRIPPGGT